MRFEGGGWRGNFFGCGCFRGEIGLFPFMAFGCGFLFSLFLLSYIMCGFLCFLFLFELRVVQ